MRDPDDDDLPHYLSGYRSPRRSEAAGIVYATLLGGFFVLFGLKLRFWPHEPRAEGVSAALLAVGPLLLLAGLATLIRRRRRDRDGRWG